MEFTYLSQSFIRNTNIVTADMDGDLVMMSIELGKYFGIGGTGRRCWEILAEPITVDALAKIICEEFNVDEITCNLDVKNFLGELMKNDLVLKVECK